MLASMVQSHRNNTLSTILKDGARPGCVLKPEHIDTLLLQFRDVFVLWDRAFLLARKIDPLQEDVDAYRLFVDAAVKGHKDLGCKITPKVYLMIDHVEWQMRNIVGGLGDKMEDWVECLHQSGKRQHQRFRTVWSGKDQALAIANANAHGMNPSVIAQINMIN